MGFLLPTTWLFGIPDRDDTLQLKETGDNPYEIWATRSLNHSTSNPKPLSGSIPYITALSPTMSSGTAWMNSARTFVSIEAQDS